MPIHGGGDEALRQASFALDGNRPHEAERIAGEVLKTEPRHAQALHTFGCALLMQGRALDAVAPLESAAHGKHNPQYDTMLAIALRQAGRAEDALRRLKLAIKRRPPYPAAFKELGHLLISMQRYDEAIEVLGRGLQAAPMMPELAAQLGYAHLSSCNYADAKSSFARALEMSPNSADALYGMAMAHFEIGEYRTAAEYLRRCLMYRPNDVSVLLNLGHSLLELDQLDAGYDCFRAAACGDQKRYGKALGSLVSSGRGRFWLKPSDAARFLRGNKS